MPARPSTEVRSSALGATALLLCAAALIVFHAVNQPAAAQAEITDEQLAAASGGRTVVIGSPGERRVNRIPLEVYVARVLAGEGEPNAPDATRQALAVAIRTYTRVQMGRHRREGFDLCDTVHCQVLRASNESSRRAALATAGRVLTINGAPAEVFYSASCGGRSEGAARVWPGATFPYMQVVRDDDVHAEDVPWQLDVTLDELRQALARAGVTADQIDLLVPHQANLRIIDATARHAEIPMDKVMVNVDRYGNTSAASIPLALAQAEQEGRLKPGMLILLVAFGAGFTWGAQVVRW